MMDVFHNTTICLHQHKACGRSLTIEDFWLHYHIPLVFPIIIILFYLPCSQYWWSSSLFSSWLCLTKCCDRQKSSVVMTYLQIRKMAHNEISILLFFLSMRYLEVHIKYSLTNYGFDVYYDFCEFLPRHYGT